MIVQSVAFGLPWNQPDVADRFLRDCPPLGASPWLTPIVTWKIATQNPERARQLVDTGRNQPLYYEHEFCLALGAQGAKPGDFECRSGGRSASPRSRADKIAANGGAIRRQAAGDCRSDRPSSR